MYSSSPCRPFLLTDIPSIWASAASYSSVYARAVVSGSPVGIQGATPDVRADERVARLLAVNSMPVVDLIGVLYPSLYSVHDIPPDVGDSPPLPSSRGRRRSAPACTSPAASSLGTEGKRFGENGNGNGNGAHYGGSGEEDYEEDGRRLRVGVDVPEALPPTSEHLSVQGIFLMDCGEALLLYVGQRVRTEVLRELFGIDALPNRECVEEGRRIVGRLRWVAEGKRSEALAGRCLSEESGFYFPKVDPLDQR